MRGVTKKIVVMIVLGCVQPIFAAFHPTSDDAFARLAYLKQKVQSSSPEHIVLYSKKDDTSDKTIARKGFLYRQKDAVGTVVICHGYQSSKQESSFLKSLFPGWNALVFDFRAHGENAEHQFSTIGRYEAYEVLAAAEFIKKDPELKDKPLIVYGISMGAVAAIEAQVLNPIFDALIVDCPYDSTDDAIERGFSNLKVNFFGKEYAVPAFKPISKIMYDERYRPIMKQVFAWVSKFDPDRVPTKFMQVRPIDSMKQITVPVLFIHCANDTKVPVQAVQKIYDSKDFGYKRLWVTKGRHHADSFISQPDEYEWMIAKFLTKYVNGRLSLGRTSRIIDARDDVASDDGREEIR